MHNNMHITFYYYCILVATSLRSLNDNVQFTFWCKNRAIKHF